MTPLMRHLIDEAYARGEKVIVCRRCVVGLPGKECWEIETYYGGCLDGRIHVHPERVYEHNPVLPLDATPAAVADVAVACHGNSYYSARILASLVIVEDAAGAVTLIHPAAT